MNIDISVLLENWHYNSPGELVVRKIIGNDGLPKIQMRVDLGLLQMAWTARPDGKTPHGKPSLLDYYLDSIDEQTVEHGSDAHVRFSHDECEILQMESLQYYYRRISFFQLEAYDEALGDAEHNLQIMDLVRKYAEDENDRMAFEQYRPFVLMHRTRAQGLIRAECQDIPGALCKIEEGIEDIEAFYQRYDQTDLIEKSQELKVLRDMAEQIKEKQPKSPEENLLEELQEAIETEDFERAAEIRDELKSLLHCLRQPCLIGGLGDWDFS